MYGTRRYPLLPRSGLLVVAFLGGLAVLGACGGGTLDTPGRDSGPGEDGGGEEDSGVPLTGCLTLGCPPGYECVYDTCVPVDPCADVVCNTPGEVCSGGVCVAGEGDLDGDGVRARDDCDDTDASIHPGAEELCNGVDDDCDGETDEGFDEDGDEYTVCGGGVSEDADCDDTDPAVFPGAEEVCNGADDDCDGAVDDGLPARACSATCGTGVESCLGGVWVCDAPDSGECSPGETGTATCGNCGSQSRTCSGTCLWGGWSACAGEGECSPGAILSDGCPNSCMATVCSSGCDWGESCASCSAACSGFSQCGTSCASGYHASRRYCDLSCTTGSCISSGDNAARCEPSCGSGFNQCGTSCPSGFHVARRWCSLDCTSSSSCISSGDNAARCDVNAGASFTMCGYSCPAGYAVSRRFCSLDCTSSSSCISAGDNAATCTRI